MQIVAADLIAQYKSEAFHGETLVVDVTPEDLNKYAFDPVYRLREKLAVPKVLAARSAPSSSKRGA